MFKKPKLLPPIRTYEEDYIWEADLMFFTHPAIAKENDGYLYILAIIDTPHHTTPHHTTPPHTTPHHTTPHHTTPPHHHTTTPPHHHIPQTTPTPTHTPPPPPPPHTHT